MDNLAFALMLINRKLDIITRELGIEDTEINSKGSFYLAPSSKAEYIIGPYDTYLKAYKQLLNLNSGMGQTSLCVYEMIGDELHKISVDLEYG